MGFKDFWKGQQQVPNRIKRILPFVFVTFLIFGSTHYLIYLTTARSIENTTIHNAYTMILIIGLFSMPLSFFASRSKKQSLTYFSWYAFIWMGLYNLLFFFSLIETLLFIFFQHQYSYWVPVLAICVGIWSLHRGLSFPQVVTHRLVNKSLAGLKLVQISDLHIGMLHLNENWLNKIVDKINLIDANILAITGDLVEGDFKDISPQLEVLKNLKIKNKFFITGNHEYIHGNGPWELRLSEMGFTSLHNENVTLIHNEAKIMIAGVPDRAVRRFDRSRFSQPDMALKSTHTVDYKILLAHQPSSVFDLKDEKCDLILSGHTHGGQIFPFHFFVRLVQPVVAGFKQINGTKVFAHQGTGLWGPPMRWFSRSEIVVFEWH